MSLVIVDSDKFREKYANIESLAGEGADYHREHRLVPRVEVLTC